MRAAVGSEHVKLKQVRAAVGSEHETLIGSGAAAGEVKRPVSRKTDPVFSILTLWA